MFVREGYKGFATLKSIWTSNKDHDEELKLEPGLFQGQSGFTLWSADARQIGDIVQSPLSSQKPVMDNRTICVRYRNVSSFSTSCNCIVTRGGV